MPNGTCGVVRGQKKKVGGKQPALFFSYSILSFFRNTLWKRKSLKGLMNQTNQTSRKRSASAAPCHERPS